MQRLLFAFIFIIVFNFASAWDNHSLMTFEAVKDMPEVKNSPPVKVESLEHFLIQEQQGLIPLLHQENKWSKEHLENFPPLPVDLEFKGGQDSAQIKEAFLKAIRVNPEFAKYDPYVQEMFQTASLSSHRPLFHGLEPYFERVDYALRETNPPLPQRKLEIGENISPLEVISSASKEPDYGMDVYLWEDSGTSYGKAYQLGPQPFGNPKVSYGTQAPFHMGFYHEAPIINFLGPFKPVYPEYRIHMYMTLSQYAFQTNHPYWGWRFLGWALHYIQDFTNPYHASVAPGLSPATLIFEDVKITVGLPSSFITLVSNRHGVLEKYVLSKVQRELTNPNEPPLLISALHDTAHDKQFPAYNEHYSRDVVSKIAYDKAPQVDLSVAKNFPFKYVSDPNYLLEATEPVPDLVEMSYSNSHDQNDQFNLVVTDLLKDFGSHTRQTIRFVLQDVPQHSQLDQE